MGGHVEVQPLESSAVLAFLLLDVAIVLIAARLVGALFVRVGQPRVVGEIVAGVLLGPTLLGPQLWADFNAPSWMNCDRGLAGNPNAAALPSPTECFFPFQARSVLSSLGQIGLLLFMFLVGLEFDSKRVTGKWRGIILVGAGVVAAPVALGFVVAPMLSGEPFQASGASSLGFSLFVGSMLAVTAFPVLARILQEKQMATTLMGSVSIAAAALVTVLMFVTMAAASTIATGGSASGLVVRILATIAYLVVMLFVVPRVLPSMSAASTEPGSAGVFVSVLILTLASGYAAQQLGLTVIVGGFVVGIALSGWDGLRAAVARRLDELTAAVLLPIFLAYSGLTTDFTMLSGDAIGGILVFLAAGVVAKWAGGLVFGRLGGLSWSESNVVGILMNCRGLLVLVVALVGIQNDVITPVMQLGAVLMALITTGMTGPLFDAFHREAAPAFAAAEPAPAEGTA